MVGDDAGLQALDPLLAQDEAEDEDDDDDEEPAYVKKDLDYCPEPEDDEDDEDDVADLDFEAEREVAEEPPPEEDEALLDGDLVGDDDDLLMMKVSGKKGKAGKKRVAAVLLSAEEVAAASLSGYSTSSLAEEIFSVTIKKKMGGPTAGQSSAAGSKKRKSAGASSSVKKKSSSYAGTGGGKRRRHSSPDDDDDFELSYGSSSSSSKRKGAKRLLPDLMYRSVTAIPMASVPLIFARVLKTLPPSDYDIYEIQNLIVTFALDDATYGSGSLNALPAAGPVEGEIAGGEFLAEQGEQNNGQTADREASETASTGSVLPNDNIPALTTSEPSSSASLRSSSSGMSSAEERIYEDVMRLVTTDKKYHHRHVPVGHSTFSHVQTDAAMLKKYEAFLTSPEQRIKRRDFLCEGSRHGWTEDELERSALLARLTFALPAPQDDACIVSCRYEDALLRSRGNVKQSAQRLGVDLERMRYFVFFYKRGLEKDCELATAPVPSTAAESLSPAVFPAYSS